MNSNEPQKPQLNIGAVSTRSCIGCQYCIVMADKQMKTSYACIQRVWTEILPKMDDLIGRTCDRYVEE